MPNEYEGPLEIINNLKEWVIQMIVDFKQSTIGKLAGTKFQEGAAMGEYSVVKIVDGIKRNLSLVEEFTNNRQKLVTLDKNVQASLLEQHPNCELHHRNIVGLPDDSLLRELGRPTNKAL